MATKYQEWTVILSNGTAFKNDGVLLGVGQTPHDADTLLAISYKKGKTAMTLNVRLPGKHSVTSAVTNVNYAATAPDEPAETPPLTLNAADAA